MHVEFRCEPFDSPAARRLDVEIHQEYVTRYGGGDETVLTTDDFAAPRGAFLIAYADGEPVACGGWRAHGEVDAEMKRVYVAPAARGRGLARRIVALLEADAGRAGRKRMILETGDGQPEALALYASLGYVTVEPFGRYANVDGAHHLGKPLPAEVAAA